MNKIVDAYTAAKRTVKEAMQRDFSSTLFGHPPVPDSKGVLRGGKPPDVTRIARILK